jgi:hypothetical protein
MPRSGACAWVLAAVLSARALPGQRVDNLESAPAFWASGVAFGVPGVRSRAVPELFTAGVSFAQVRHGLGADIALLTIPRALAEGFVPIGVRLGAGHGIPLGADAFFMPSAGLVALGTIGAYSTFATGGVYAGAALIGFGGQDTGVRVAYTVHYFDVRSMVWQLEVGLVGRRRTKD